ncbi:MAG: DUF4388 domain-containing protein [Desulfobulbaceae bacterium]|nr:DUF4388 domain-containing protein [Desulfobulbaceae bacterium]
MEGVALQGDLAAIELNNIFQFLDYAALSGELRIIAEANKANFFFQNGVLIFGSLSVNQKRIGEMLLESEAITRGQLSHCLQEHSRSNNEDRLGELIVQKGFLGYDRLSEILQCQAREAFFETLNWVDGMFYFYINQYPSEKEILINERIDHLLLEGIVRMDDQAAEAADD